MACQTTEGIFGATRRRCGNLVALDTFPPGPGVGFDLHRLKDERFETCLAQFLVSLRTEPYSCVRL
jgi:hypothetical protein